MDFQILNGNPFYYFSMYFVFVMLPGFIFYLNFDGKISPTSNIPLSMKSIFLTTPNRIFKYSQADINRNIVMIVARFAKWNILKTSVRLSLEFMKVVKT
jgi:hypothetical protein